MTIVLQHWIDGERRGDTLFVDRLRPSDGKPWSKVPIASQGTVDDAVASARTALPAWRKLSVQERCKFVSDMAEWIGARYGEAGQETAL